jgi:hypothetical protein
MALTLRKARRSVVTGRGASTGVVSRQRSRFLIRSDSRQFLASREISIGIVESSLYAVLPVKM